MFRYSGGEDDVMTPYMCMENCMGQQLHQRYDKNLVVGITQGTMCLCGYDYELKKAAACKSRAVPLIIMSCDVMCLSVSGS